jgi:hypothetical protein
MVNKYGVTITESTYDGMGNRTELLALDAAGKPALHKEGWSRAILTYDDCGNQIEAAYFDTSGKPCLNKGGYAKAALKYDERGNLIEGVFFDANGKPCLNKNRIAKAALKYGGRGNSIEEACFDTNGKPCLNKDGIAKKTNKLGMFQQRYVKRHEIWHKPAYTQRDVAFCGLPKSDCFQAANFGGLIPTESCSFSSEKSYSPSRLICCQDTTEPFAMAWNRISRASDPMTSLIFWDK